MTTRALDGIQILDLTRLLPGAVTTMMLADMGADVIKIEDPTHGDYARWTPPLVDGLGAFFRASNRNKRSMTLNLKHAQGQVILHRLVASADVVIEGFRPGVTQRLRADYATLTALNPRLVYCSLSGWGQTGPYRDLSGHDVNYLALNGVLGSMGDPQLLGGQVADVGGAYVGVMGILAALFKRERTNTGDWIDVSLSDAAMPFAMYQFVESVVAGMGGGAGSLTGRMAYYNIYHSQDGRALALAAIEPKFWANFCNAVEHPEWIAIQNDMQQQAALKAHLRDLFATRSADAWHDLLSEADCCFTLVTPPQAITDDPHVQAREMARITAEGLPIMRSPVRLHADDAITIQPAPAYGEHTREILQDLGYSTDEITTFAAAGIVRRTDDRA
jgi:alpha-methylacyl-CoA racemase